MITQKIDAFKVVGITVKTNNQNGNNARDIGALWGKFFSDNIAAQVHNKLNNNIYVIYTDYENDFSGEYTTIIGFKIDNIADSDIPAGLVAREFVAGNFLNFTAKGKVPDAVVATWQDIWSKDAELKRNYSYDFEVYGENSNNGDGSEVGIFIAVN